MKKYFLLLILLLNGPISAQSLKYAVLSNMASIGENRAITADSISKSMLSSGEIKALISIGNITKSGTFQEFEDAKSFFDSLNTTLNVLPGSNEFKQSQTGYFNYKKNFAEDNFYISESNIAIIGLQAVDLINFRKGHLSKETLEWLKTTILGFRGKNIILFLNSEIERIDNAEKLISALEGFSVVKIITPGFAEKLKKGNKTLRKRTIKKPEVIPFLHIFEINNDSLSIFGYQNNNGFLLVEKKKLEKINLKEMINTSKSKDIFKNLLNLNSSTDSKILPYKNNLILSDLNGSISSYNPDFTLKWQFKVQGSLLCPPMIAGNRLIAATTLGEIFIIDPDTKTEIQSIGTNCEIVSSLMIIQYNGNKELLIPKSGNSKEALVFAASSGELYCYDLETLQELWINNDSNSPLTGNIIYSGNKLVFKNYDGKIICIDTRTGLLNWRWGYKDIIADTHTGLAYNGKQVITLTDNQAVNGIDILLGVSEWQTEENNISDFSLLPGKQDTIAALSNKNITFYDSKKGTEIKSIKLKEKNIISILKTDGSTDRLFFLSDENDLFTLEKEKSLRKIGNTGSVSIVSIINNMKNGFYLLNYDGQLQNMAIK